MSTNVFPDLCNCGGPITRRTFLKTTLSGVAAAAAAPLPILHTARAADAGTKAPTSETLVATLYKSLSEAQRKVVAFPFDHPLRLKVDNNWHIIDKKLSEFFTPDQQAMIREIFNGLHSPAYAERVLKQVEANGFDNLHMAFYKNHDIGNDGVWDVWQIEGPAMLWYFRGEPHVHTWVHVRQSA